MSDKKKAAAIQAAKRVSRLLEAERSGASEVQIARIAEEIYGPNVSDETGEREIQCIVDYLLEIAECDAGKGGAA